MRGASDGDWGEVIAGLRSGDNEAVGALCRAYGSALERIARSHMASVLRQRVGPEDVVQSVYRTFLRRVGEGQLIVDDAADLWRLLCAITLTKVREQARFHMRRKRGLDRELAMDASPDGSSPIADPAPTPEDQQVFIDLFEELISGLDREEQEIVVRKLDGHTNREIATAVRCSERTVERLLARLRGRLEELLSA